MKQQATTVINENRVNDAHMTQLDAPRKKSNSTVAYIQNMLPIDSCINHTANIK